jgi:hypothetical protein
LRNRKHIPVLKTFYKITIETKLFGAGIRTNIKTREINTIFPEINPQWCQDYSLRKNNLFSK